MRELDWCRAVTSVYKLFSYLKMSKEVEIVSGDTKLNEHKLREDCVQCAVKL
jgi:hypothetical protein